MNNLDKAKAKHEQLKQDLAELVEEMESGAMVLSKGLQPFNDGENEVLIPGWLT